MHQKCKLQQARSNHKCIFNTIKSQEVQSQPFLREHRIFLLIELKELGRICLDD